MLEGVVASLSSLRYTLPEKFHLPDDLAKRPLSLAETQIDRHTRNFPQLQL